ncbi:MAG: VOC family protein [Acidobacteria bacterium]|nr:VOC family protein [Acidobacteriota bacterium]
MTSELDSSDNSLSLPPIDQVAYMVADRDEAVARLEPLFGPFETMDVDNPGSIYKGDEHDVSLRLAFGRSGDLEIELIEHVSGLSPHKDWYDEHGESIFHVRFKVDDVDAYLAWFEDEGNETIWYNASLAEHGIKYAYSQAPPAKGGHIFEFVQGF